MLIRNQPLTITLDVISVNVRVVLLDSTLQVVSKPLYDM